MIAAGMATGPRGSVCLGLCAGLLVCAWLAPVAEAQPSARDRASAADAYDRGSAEFLAENFETAAGWFETAYRLAPAPAALIQAIRSHQRAENPLRAATLALTLREAYPDDPRAARAAAGALAGANRYVRVEVRCEACALEIDGALVGRSSFFVEPGAPHTLVASFDTGNVTREIEGQAGETLPLTFEAPAATDPGDGPGGGPPGGGTEDEAGGGGGVPLWISVAALVVTAGLGGVTIWSGIDTLDGVPAYEANPTLEGLQDGRDREARTNWLIASTSVAAAATLVLFLFTDYGGGSNDDSDDDSAEEASAEAWLDIGPDQAILGLRGRL